MAATPRTMAEVLASSIPSLNNTNSNINSKNLGNGDTGGASISDNKDESDTSYSNIMIKTFPFLTITVYIPTACVGALIGKRGSNIDSIQKLAAKESAKSQASSRGARNKSSKQNKNSSSNTPKAVSPDSVRISVVNYPPPPGSSQQSFDQDYKHLQNLGIESGHTSSSGQQQHHHQQVGGPSAAAMMDMGAPPTYTELDFSDPQWTPIVIRADPIAAIYASNAIHDICCPEYVVDRNQLVFIMDVPVPAVAATNTNNSNLRHASIVGKRGNKLIQLSADHRCRIMVPPKQLGHDVIQLEAPLKECSSCLKAIMGKLQAGGPDEKEQPGDATNMSVSTPPSKNSKNNATNKGNNNGKNRNDNSAKNNFQSTLIIQPLPSQTKLRNIARKTETKILKKRIPKSQQKSNQNQKQSPQQQKQEQELDSKQPPEQSLETGEAEDQLQEKQEQTASNSNNNGNNNENKISWRLTVVAASEKKVLKAVDMLKVLNSKGYEVVVVEESCANNNSVDTSSKTVSEVTLGGSESDADAAVEESAEALKPTATTNAHNGRGGGRGGRNKKQRYRNNHRGHNGKDSNANSGKQQQQVTAIPPTAAVGDS